MLNGRPLVLALFAASLGHFHAAASTSILVSVADQKLALVRDGETVAEYRISTSRFGLGDKHRSYATPLGKLEIAERVGDGLPLGAVLKGREATGEVLAVNAKGRDPIVTRILHLRGLEARNDNAFGRGIYIHGTPVEKTIGKPDSWGCIRMRSKDVIALFDAAPIGTPVEIVEEKIRRALPEMLAATKPNPEPVAEGAPSKTVAAAKPSALASENRRIAAAAVGGKRLATAREEKRSAESPKNMHFGMASITELQSLGGVSEMRVRQEREARERQANAGLFSR